MRLVLPIVSAKYADLLVVASASGSNSGVVTKLQGLLEYLLEAISQPLTLGALIVLTVLLVLWLVVATGT